MDKPTAFGVIIAALVAGAAGGMVLAFSLARNSEIGAGWFLGPERTEPAPIAVIDVGAVVKRAKAPEGSDTSRAEVALEAIRKASTTLTRQGYLVLDKRAVLRAPSRLEVGGDAVLQATEAKAGSKSAAGQPRGGSS